MKSESIPTPQDPELGCVDRPKQTKMPKDKKSLIDEITSLKHSTDEDEIAAKYEGAAMLPVNLKISTIEDEIAEKYNTAAQGIVVGDLQRSPRHTEMPDDTIYASPFNQPDGTKHIGAFGPIEQRVADEAGRKPKKGWVGTAYVADPGLSELGQEPQAAAAPPPPPPPEGPSDGPFSGDDNKMPPQDYDKTAFGQENQFNDSGEDKIADIQNDIAEGLVKPDNNLENQAIIDHGTGNPQQDVK